MSFDTVTLRVNWRTEGSKTVLISRHYDSPGAFGIERVSWELARALLVPKAYSL